MLTTDYNQFMAPAPKLKSLSQIMAAKRRKATMERLRLQQVGMCDVVGCKRVAQYYVPDGKFCSYCHHVVNK